MASRVTSRHHWYDVSNIVIKPISRVVVVFVCIHVPSPQVVKSAAVAARIGHGLGSTMWNGWV